MIYLCDGIVHAGVTARERKAKNIHIQEDNINIISQRRNKWQQILTKKIGVNKSKLQPPNNDTFNSPATNKLWIPHFTSRFLSPIKKKNS